MRVKVLFLGLMLTSLAENVQNTPVQNATEAPAASTKFEPVCAVNDYNQYKIFPNKCMLEYEQEATGVGKT